MKQTENYEQLLERFTKRFDQVLKKRDELTEQPESGSDFNIILT